MKKLKKFIVGTTLAVAAFASLAQGAEGVAQKNKAIVVEFYQKLFGDKDIEAIDQYLAPDYIQHNPTVADGTQALKAAARGWFKDAAKEKIEFANVVAEGDRVVLHLKKIKRDTGKAAAFVDIFRLEDGKIVEHWDVIQDVPERAANAHPMF